MFSRKIIPLVVLLCSAIALVPAQESNSPEIEVAVGPGFPLGEFRDEEEGAARTGFMASLIGRYRLEPSFGLFAAYALNVNSVDLDSAAEDLSAIDPTLNWKASADSWLANSVLVGPFVAHNTGTLELELLAGIGITIGRSPSLEVEASDGIDTVTASQEAATGATLGLFVSGRMRYWVNQQLGIFFGLSYLYAEPEFDDVGLEARINGSLYNSDTTSFNQVFSVLSIPLGLTISF